MVPLADDDDDNDDDGALSVVVVVVEVVRVEALIVFACFITD